MRKQGRGDKGCLVSEWIALGGSAPVAASAVVHSQKAREASPNGGLTHDPSPCEANRPLM